MCAFCVAVGANDFAFANFRRDFLNQVLCGHLGQIEQLWTQFGNMIELHDKPGIRDIAVCTTFHMLVISDVSDIRVYCSHAWITSRLQVVFRLKNQDKLYGIENTHTLV